VFKVIEFQKLEKGQPNWGH